MEMEKEKAGLEGEHGKHVVLDEKAALAADLEAAEVHVDGTDDDANEEDDGERGLADRERGGEEEEDDEDGDEGEVGGDDGFGDFQGGAGGDAETGTGAVPIPNLLDTLKGIDGRGGLSMSYDSGVTEPEQHDAVSGSGADGEVEGGGEDWLGGLR